MDFNVCLQLVIHMSLCYILKHVIIDYYMHTEFLVGKPEGRRPLGRPTRRWKDNIKMDMREVGCVPGDWIALVGDRDQWRAYVRTVMNPRVP